MRHTASAGRLVLPFVGVLVYGAAAAQQVAPQAATLDVGAEAPALTGEDVEGKALNWQRWPNRAVVVVFHAHGARLATAALGDIAKTCAADAQLRREMALLVVTDGEAGVADVRAALAGADLAHAVTIDPERRRFVAYRAIAFPTVFTLDKERRIVEVARGPGPLLATKAHTAAHFAAGLIDRAEFERALQPGEAREVSRTARVANLVERLLARESYDSARKLLAGALQEAPEAPNLLELAARLDLAEDKGDAADQHIAHLERAIGRGPQTRLLRAELLLLRDDAKAALAELEGLPLLTLRSALVRGQALERLERHAEAAAVYRQALLRQMRQATGG